MRGGPHLLQIGEPLPPAHRADAEGLVAVGGTLDIARVLSAYRRGIFPWPLLGPGSPVLWFSPDPRFVVSPQRVHIGRSLRRSIARREFRVTCDQRFCEVIGACARAPRRGQAGTWITPELEAAFQRLHELGYAHSVEVWAPDDADPAGEVLVGGLYGLSLGRVFFGESMFSLRSNASKVAFARLALRLAEADFELIDCQQETEHLARLGARSMSRDGFVDQISRSVDRTPSADPWDDGGWG